MQIMSKNHIKWDEFREELAELIAVNGCDESAERPNAKAVLAGMGFAAEDIKASLAYFEKDGGRCDCDIILFVGANEDFREVGFLCSHCTTVFDNPDGHGFPVLCHNCYDSASTEERAGLRRATIKELHGKERRLEPDEKIEAIRCAVFEERGFDETEIDDILFEIEDIDDPVDVKIFVSRKLNEQKIRRERNLF